MARLPEEGMVFIPPGPFIMGSDWEPFYGTIIPELAHVRRDESPMQIISLGGYWIDRRPVTNREYARFVAATNARPPRHWPGENYPEGEGDFPVVNVNWQEAQAYAVWAGKRLPTEAEWEKAARGVDGRLYPWGNTFALEKCSSIRATDAKEPLWETPMPRLEPVGHHPEGASPYGIEDMAGNIWEWTASPYLPYPGNPSRRGDYRESDIVIRGGSWREVSDRTSHLYFRCANRWHVPPTTRANNIGFRCVRDALPEEQERWTQPSISPATLQEHALSTKRHHLQRVIDATSHAMLRDGSLALIAIGGGMYLLRKVSLWALGLMLLIFGAGLLTCVGINLWRYRMAVRRRRELKV